MSGSSTGRPMDDGLGLQVVAEGGFAPFTPVARCLVAAERGREVLARAVDVDHAGFDPGRDLFGPLVRAGLHIGGEAVGGVVGDADGLLDITIANDAEHRAEDLFARYGHVVRYVGENGGPDVVALREAVRPPRTARHEGRSLFETLANEALDARPLPL